MEKWRESTECISFERSKILEKSVLSSASTSSISSTRAEFSSSPKIMNHSSATQDCDEVTYISSDDDKVTYENEFTNNVHHSTPKSLMKLRKRRVKIATVGATFYVDMWEQDPGDEDENDAQSNNGYTEITASNPKTFINSDWENMKEDEVPQLNKNYSTTDKIPVIVTPMKRNYDWDLCKESFFSERLLEMHQLEHEDGISNQPTSHFLKSIVTENKIQPVQECNYRVQLQNNSKEGLGNVSKTDYYNKLKGYDGITPARLTCSYCQKELTNKHSLKRHIRTVHLKEKTFQCKYEGCQKMYAHRESLKYHVQTHTGIKPCRCPNSICQMLFPSQSTLFRHLCVHIKPNDIIPIEIQSFLEEHKVSLLNCDICGKIFYGKYYLKKHKTSHKMLQCKMKECGKQFIKMREFEMHLRTHPELNYLKCPLNTCQKIFFQNWYFMQHVCSHLNKRNRPEEIREILHKFDINGYKHYICAFCGFVSVHRWYFQIHVLKHIKGKHSIMEKWRESNESTSPQTSAILEKKSCSSTSSNDTALIDLASLSSSEITFLSSTMQNCVDVLHIPSDDISPHEVKSYIPNQTPNPRKKHLKPKLRKRTIKIITIGATFNVDMWEPDLEAEAVCATQVPKKGKPAVKRYFMAYMIVEKLTTPKLEVGTLAEEIKRKSRSSRKRDFEAAKEQKKATKAKNAPPPPPSKTMQKQSKIKASKMQTKASAPRMNVRR